MEREEAASEEVEWGGGGGAEMKDEAGGGGRVEEDAGGEEVGVELVGVPASGAFGEDEGLAWEGVIEKPPFSQWDEEVLVFILTKIPSNFPKKYTGFKEFNSDESFSTAFSDLLAVHATASGSI